MQGTGNGVTIWCPILPIYNVTILCPVTFQLKGMGGLSVSVVYVGQSMKSVRNNLVRTVCKTINCRGWVDKDQARDWAAPRGICTPEFIADVGLCAHGIYALAEITQKRIVQNARYLKRRRDRIIRAYTKYGPRMGQIMPKNARKDIV